MTREDHIAAVRRFVAKNRKKGKDRAMFTLDGVQAVLDALDEWSTAVAKSQKSVSDRVKAGDTFYGHLWEENDE